MIIRLSTLSDFEQHTRSRYLVVGGEGQVGSRLVSHFKENNQYVFSTVFFKDQIGEDEVFLDLSKDFSEKSIPGRFDVAFLCAALTSTELCRAQPLITRKVNVDNTLALARQLSKHGTALFFPSTNLVFDGSLPFRKAHDPVNPSCEYGRQKVETECGLAELTDRLAIIRFTKIIASGMVLLQNWVSDLRQGKIIHPFSDMVLAPVSLRYAAEAIVKIMQGENYGLWQVSAKADVTYEEMARYLAQKMGVSQKLIRPVQATQSGLVLQSIPPFSTLDTSRLNDELGLESPDAWEALDEFIKVQVKNG
ncbi:MAG: sugar nucleotide-binding protein [Syntrophales bacterium]